MLVYQSTYQPRYVDELQAGARRWRSEFVAARVDANVLQADCEAISAALLQCAKVYAVRHQFEASCTHCGHAACFHLASYPFLNLAELHSSNRDCENRQRHTHSPGPTVGRLTFGRPTVKPRPGRLYNILSTNFVFQSPENRVVSKYRCQIIPRSNWAIQVKVEFKLSSTV